MNHGIIEASELPEGEKVYLKKDRWGWRTVQPIKDENGKNILVNLMFGGMRNLIFLITVLIIIAIVSYSYYHDVTQVQQFCQHALLQSRGGEFAINESSILLPLSPP